MAVAQAHSGPPHQSELEHERVEQYREERRYIVRTPIPGYYAFLVALALLPLGVLGLVPALTRGGVLLGLLRTSPEISVLYLVTSLAGFAAFAIRRGDYAHLFTLVLTGVYLFTFSTGNVEFGNSEGITSGPPDFPWIFENALHAGLMLTGALITGLAALQQGDRATLREFEKRYGITDPRDREPTSIPTRLPVLGPALDHLKNSHPLRALKKRLSRTAALVGLTLVSSFLFTLVAGAWHAWSARDDLHEQRGAGGPTSTP